MTRRTKGWIGAAVLLTWAVVVFAPLAGCNQESIDKVQEEVDRLGAQVGGVIAEMQDPNGGVQQIAEQLTGVLTPLRPVASLIPGWGIAVTGILDIVLAVLAVVQGLQKRRLKEEAAVTGETLAAVVQAEAGLGGSEMDAIKAATAKQLNERGIRLEGDLLITQAKGA